MPPSPKMMSMLQVYVQHLMKRDALQLGSLIEAGAYVFVCGDGAGMAKDVHSTLIQALKESQGLTEEVASQKLQSMVQDKRYIRDVWS